VHERQGTAVGDRHLRERQTGRPERVDGQPGCVDGVAVVRREVEGVRRHCRDGAGDADHGRDRLEAVQRRRQHGVEVMHGGGDFGHRRRVTRQEALGEPDRADVEGRRPLDVGALTDHQLGGATADVDHHRASGFEAPCGTDERRQGLLLTAEHLRTDAEDRLDGSGEVVGVLGVPSGRRGAEPDPVCAQHRDQLGVLAGGLQGAVDRLGGQPPGRVDTLTETDDAQLAHELRFRAVGDVGDEQADRVGAAVDRRDTVSAGHAPEVSGYEQRRSRRCGGAR
jgi:hypothetical protein